MGSTTGIELGPDFCVLVAVRPRRTGPADVLALHTIERSEWPLRDTALTETLRALRLAKKFPRKARIVVWTLPDGATRDDPVAAGMLRPLIAAGFRVDALLSPPQALASLAASRPRTGTTAWLAVNVHGAAIAIVRGRELLFSRTFDWSYNAAVLGSRAQLLQRYSLVAQLAPEIQRGMEQVRLEHGEVVTTAITCGDLPELRSLTMPLIEELDIEVETLDSTDGLKAVGKARMERFPESAPTIRLACAAALSTTHSSRSQPPVWVWAAAGAALVAALAVGAVVYRNSRTVDTPVLANSPVAPQGRHPSATVPPPVQPVPTPMESKPGSGAALPSTAVKGAAAVPLAPVARPGSPFIPPASGSGSMVTPVTPKVAVPPASTTSPAPPASKPAVTTHASIPTPGARPGVTTSASAAPAAGISTPSALKPAPHTTLTPTIQGLPPRVSAPAAATKAVPAAPPPVSASKPVPAVAYPPMIARPAPIPATGTSRPEPSVIARAPKPGSAVQRAAGAPVIGTPAAKPGPTPPPVSSEHGAQSVAAAPPKTVPSALPGSAASAPSDPVASPAAAPVVGKRQAPLKDPLPRVDSILVDQDRRLAFLDGTVTRVGDVVGPRVVAQIDRDGVVFREPSGLLVRVTLRSKSQSK